MTFPGTRSEQPYNPCLLYTSACDEEQQAAIYKLMNEQISKQTMMDKFGMTEEEVAELHLSFTCRALEKDDFLVLNSGFFALGLVLGLVFICGAVLIMYYKQIIEGYEDQSRFEILQKVGMKMCIRDSPIHFPRFHRPPGLPALFFRPASGEPGLPSAYVFPLWKINFLLKSNRFRNKFYPKM